MTSPDLAADLEQSVAEIALALFAPRTVSGVLQRIVDEAATAVEGCDLAGLLLRRDGEISTAAYSDPQVIEVDALQASTGEGPCLDVATSGGTLYAIDLADDARWPHFGPAGVAAGIRSVYAVQVSARRSSVLNLYSRLPAAFGATDRAKALILAALAGLALASAEEREDDWQREVNLEAALATREVIGQAQGILMERERITAAEAFNTLRRASQHLNIKLRDVAQHLVDTGETGEPPPSRSGRRGPAR